MGGVPLVIGCSRPWREDAIKWGECQGEMPTGAAKRAAVGACSGVYLPDVQIKRGCDFFLGMFIAPFDLLNSDDIHSPRWVDGEQDAKISNAQRVTCHAPRTFF